MPISRRCALRRSGCNWIDSLYHSFTFDLRSFAVRIRAKVASFLASAIPESSSSSVHFRRLVGAEFSAPVCSQWTTLISLCSAKTFALCVLSVTVCVVGCFGKAACAQNTGLVGIVPDISRAGADFDSTNMSNGYQTFRIPLMSYPQLGKLKLSFSMVAQSATYPRTTSCSQPAGSIDPIEYAKGVGVLSNCSVRWTALTPLLLFTIEPLYSVTAGGRESIWWNCSGTPSNCIQSTRESTYPVVIDFTGASHPMAWDSSSGTETSGYTSARSIDGSKFLLTTSTPAGIPSNTIPSNPTVIDSNGVSYSSGLIKDPNGNTITINPTSEQITDSVGRVISLPVTDSSVSPSCPNLNAAYQPVVSSAHWTIPGANGGSLTYTICYATIAVHTNFTEQGGSDIGKPLTRQTNVNGVNVTTTYTDENAPFGVVQSIVLPLAPGDTTPRYWGFIYDAANPSDTTSVGYGDITNVIEPDGANIAYTHDRLADCVPYNYLNGVDTNPLDLSYHSATASRATTLSSGTTYNESFQWDGALLDNQSNRAFMNTHTFGDGSSTQHYFTPALGAGGFEPECRAVEYQTDVLNGQTILSTTTNTYIYNTNWGDQFEASPASYTAGTTYTPWAGNAVIPILQSKTTTFASGLSTTTTTGFDSGFTGANVNQDTANGNSSTDLQTETVIRGVPVSSTTVGYSGETIASTTTQYQWQNNAAYYTANLMNLPATTTLASSASTGTSANTFTTTYGYDNSSISPGGVRGNLTSVAKAINSTSSVTTKTGYGDNGVPFEWFDGNNNLTKVNSFQCSGLFPQSVTAASGSTTTTPETSTFVYDCNTGKITSQTDPNGNPTKYTYDVLARPLSVSYPDGGSTTINYNGDPTPPQPTVTTVLGNSAPNLVRDYFYDGLGRLARTRLTSDPSGPDYVDTTYDDQDRVLSVSNPYRTTQDPTYGTTAYTYDALSRKTVEQHTPDNSSQQWCYDGIATSSQTNCGKHISATSGEWVDFADENGNDWQQTSDALGRLTSVIEPNGTSTSPSMETDYKYDAAGDLFSLTQWGGTSGSTGARTRSFLYDGLSRLTNVCNPETIPTGSACTGSGPWSDTYGYDANGNVLTRTDARNITTTSTYDALNRITKKTYSDGVTPEMLYGYDGTSIGFVPVPSDPARDVQANLTNTIGRMIYATAVGLTLDVFSYDSMGRLANRWASSPSYNTDGSVALLSATYDLAGDRASLTNSTGRTFNYTYNGAGRLQTASNTVTLNGTPVTTPMVNSMTYFPSGQPQTMTTDTGSATITGTWGVDTRLRVTSYQNLSTANTAGTNYGYSLTYMPNSNVLADAETVYNPASGAMSWSWNFGYDTLNRLTNAQSSGAVQLGCAWTYDAFGNRLSQQPSGTGLSCTTATTPVNANNRLSGAIYSYDAAGDTLTEGGNTLTYDAEGRILAAGSTSYLYDGTGQRTSKIEGGVETDFVRDFDGTLLDTYVSGSYINQPQEMWITGKHYGSVYAFVINGVQEQTEGLSLTNWLGSEAIRSFPASNGGANTGIPTYAFLSQPFGDGQTTLMGSDNDDIHFTGKERDAESGNDYFNARYFGSSMGRFLSPDPLGGSLVNPQSLNRYAYAFNNPLRFTDPTGMYVTNCASGDKACAKNASAFEKSRQHDLKSKNAGTRAAAGAYGDPGQKNGVTVGFGDPGKGRDGITTVTGLQKNADGSYSADATVTIRPGQSGAELDSTVGHEGQHVEDAQGFAATVTPQGYYDLSKNLTQFQTEMNAYGITNSVLSDEGVTANSGTCSDGPCVLGFGVTNPNSTIKQLLANPANGYGVTEANPGQRQFGNLPPNPVPQAPAPQ